MVVLIRTLTRCTPVCCRIRFQSLALDRLTTTYADTVCAQRNAFQGALDSADFLYIPGDLCQVDVDEQVGERLILEIVDPTGDIGVAFVVGPQEDLACLVPQFAPSVPQLVLEV